MICNNCGTSNDPNAKYCASCGSSLTAVEANAASDEGKGFAIASLVLGIVSIFCFAIITGTLAIVFSRMAKSKGSQSGMATAGMVLGIIGIVAWALMLIIGLI